jgi:hypothetical protein
MHVTFDYGILEESVRPGYIGVYGVVVSVNRKDLVIKKMR